MEVTTGERSSPVIDGNAVERVGGFFNADGDFFLVDDDGRIIDFAASRPICLTADIAKFNFSGCRLPRPGETVTLKF